EIDERGRRVAPARGADPPRTGERHPGRVAKPARRVRCRRRARTERHPGGEGRSGIDPGRSGDRGRRGLRERRVGEGGPCPEPGQHGRAIAEEVRLALEAVAQLLEVGDDVVAAVGAAREGVEVAPEVNPHDGRSARHETASDLLERRTPASGIREEEDQSVRGKRRGEKLDPAEAAARGQGELGCGTGRFAARLRSCYVLRVAQPLRWREVLQRETERAWPVTLAVVTGILGAAGNIVFRAAIRGCTWLFQGQAARLGDGGIPLALVAGGLVLLLLDRIFPGEVLGYGFPRFLEMLHLQGARVKRRWMVVKTLGAAVSLGAGAAVGREGPIAQIGGSIGSAVAQLARLSSEQRKILIACGAAAGIAMTFNAPLGALMFAHEIVLLGEVRLVNFTQIVIATTTAVIVARGLFGSLPVFVVPSFTLESYWECFTYAALGVVLGLLAAAYTRLFHAVAGYLRRLAWPRAAVLLARLSLVGVLDF